MKRTMTEMDDDKALLILKLGLVLENGRWFSKKENTHPAVVFTEHYVATHDVLAMLFRANKLCLGKLKYFRTNFDLFEPFKYDYEKGFIPTELWDAEFFRHRPTGYFIDLRFLQTITVFKEFVAFCRKLEDDQKNLFQSHMKWAEKGDNTSKSRLGDCYYYGWGTEQNFSEAVKWYRQVAPLGDEAARQLGFCYLNGEGVDQDDTEAFKWLQHAAIHGDEPARSFFKLINVEYKFVNGTYVEGTLADNLSYRSFCDAMKARREKNESHPFS